MSFDINLDDLEFPMLHVAALEVFSPAEIEATLRVERKAIELESVINSGKNKTCVRHDVGASHCLVHWSWSRRPSLYLFEHIVIEYGNQNS
jgi:hypothetical protein